MRWIQSLSLTQKVMFFSAAVFALALAAQLLASLALERAGRRMDVLYNGHLQSVAGLISAEASINAAELELQRLLAASDPDRRLLLRESLEKKSQSADTALTRFSENILDQNTATLSDTLIKNWREYTGLRFKALQLAVNMRDSEARAILDGTALKSLARTRAALAGLIRANSDSGAAFLSESRLNISSVQNLIWVAVILCAICAAGLGLWLTGSLERPLFEVRSVLRQLAAGSSTINTEPLERENLPELAKDVHALLAAQRDLNTALQQLAKGERPEDSRLDSTPPALRHALAAVFSGMERLLHASQILRLEACAPQDVPFPSTPGVAGILRETLLNLEDAHRTFRLRSTAWSDHLRKIADGEIPLNSGDADSLFDPEALEAVNKLGASLRAVLSDSAQVLRDIQETATPSQPELSRHKGIFRGITANIAQISSSLLSPLALISETLRALGAGGNSPTLPEKIDGPWGNLLAPLKSITSELSALRRDSSDCRKALGEVSSLCGELHSCAQSAIEEVGQASSSGTSIREGLSHASSGTRQVITWFRDAAPRLENSASLLEQTSAGGEQLRSHLEEIRLLSEDLTSDFQSFQEDVRRWGDIPARFPQDEFSGSQDEATTQLAEFMRKASHSLDTLAAKLATLHESASGCLSKAGELERALSDCHQTSCDITGSARETISLSSGMDRAVEESAGLSAETSAHLSSALEKISILKDRSTRISELAKLPELS